MKKSAFIIFTVLALILSFPALAEAATEQEYYDQGVALFNQGSYEEALHNFEEASALNPAEPAYYDWQGSCLYYLVAFDEALQAFNHALTIEPYHTTYEYKGVCLFALGRPQEALAAFDQSIALHPYQNNYFWKAAIQLDLQNFDDAARTYLSVVALNDISSETKALAYNNAAYVLYLNQNYGEAMTAVENGLALKSDQPSLYKNEGLILEAQGNFTEALANYDQALQVDPQNEASLAARRALLARMNGEELNPSEYVEWQEIQLYVPLDKVWTLTFNRPVDINTAREYIYIADEGNNRLNLKIEAGNNANEMRVGLNSEQGYLPAARYTLWVPADVASINGVKMLNGVRMDFITK